MNENPLVQAALIGVLALVIGALLLMRMGGGAEEPPASSDASASADPAASVPAAEPAEPGPTVAPPTEGTEPPVPAAATPTGFEAGPGLPQPVVDAYEAGDVVVLLVVRENGIDDRRLQEIVERLRARPDTALFEVRAKGIVRYSRIAQGVEVERTPALVVISPKALSEGPMPTATVSYGFRGAKSVEQAVDDAAYKGPSQLPYYPR